MGHGNYRFEILPEAEREIDEVLIPPGSSHRAKTAAGKMLAEIKDLIRFQGPHRGYEHRHRVDAIATVVVYLWKYEEYEMFYAHEDSGSESITTVLHVCVVASEYDRQKALQTVRARLDC
jgi:hypothetical protein